MRALSTHGPFHDAHYQSVTGLVLRTITVLVWKVLAARCLWLYLSDGEHWPQLSPQFATPICVNGPGGIDVTVSAPSPQRVAAEQALVLPQLSLASPASA